MEHRKKEALALFAEELPEQVDLAAFNCVGTAGTAGTVGSCYGSVGTYACLSSN
ncbi:thiocillin family RiPP [Bacillus sp. FSL W7-1360]